MFLRLVSVSSLASLVLGSLLTTPRLLSNNSQAYLAFFVIDDLQMAQSAKALVSGKSNKKPFLSVVITLLYDQCFSIIQIPAIIYICSFVVSVMLQVTTSSNASVVSSSP